MLARTRLATSHLPRSFYSPYLCIHRYYTTPPSHASPSPKVVALPFRLSPTTALERVYQTALINTARPINLFYALGRRFLGSFAIQFAEWLGYDPGLKMIDMKGVYWPCWRCDVMLEGKARNMYSESKGESSGWIGITEMYVPGNSFAPLSYLSFGVPPILDDDLPIYDPSKDLTQLGVGFDIVPVPFTISPLSVLEKIRAFATPKLEWDGLTLEAEKWKDTLTGCYPLMFPIYVAEFEADRGGGDKRSFNVIMDAHHEDPNQCRLSFPPPKELFEAQTRFSSKYFLKPAPFMPIATFLLPMKLAKQPSPSFKPRVDFTSITASVSDIQPRDPALPPGAEELMKAYDDWISPKPTSYSSIPPSPLAEIERKGEGVNWEDVRIQSWNSEERAENGEYLTWSVQARNSIGLFETMQMSATGSPPNAEGAVVHFVDGKPTFTKKPMTEVISDMRKSMAGLKAELETRKPGWLKKLEKENRAGDVGEKLVKAVQAVDSNPIVSKALVSGGKVKRKGK